MAREYISKDNLSKFASLVKGSINTAQSTANTARLMLPMHRRQQIMLLLQQQELWQRLKRKWLL